MSKSGELPSPRESTRLGHYELHALLGAGGMGEVYRARDLKLDRDVALKLLPPGVQADRHRLDRFAQEARATARLSHPNILVVHELAEEVCGCERAGVGGTTEPAVAQRDEPIDVRDTGCSDQVFHAFGYTSNGSGDRTCG